MNSKTVSKENKFVRVFIEADCIRKKQEAKRQKYLASKEEQVKIRKSKKTF